MSFRANRLAFAALSTFAFAAYGCAVAPESGDDTPIGSAAAAVTETLTDKGGPVLTNVEVVPVLWNSSVSYQAKLESFYDGFVSSEVYADVLSQYSSIGKGTYGGSYTLDQTSTSVTDADVQAALTAMFVADPSVAPTGSTYYPVHMPSGVTAYGVQGKASCSYWCGYHSSFKYNGVDVAYGVIIDMDSCSSCGESGVAASDNLTAASSHEMLEATTDPYGRIGAGYGWIDTSDGDEIADLCEHNQATIFGSNGNPYVVTKLWSNSADACVWGELADKWLTMDGTCYPTNSILLQHEYETLIFQGDGNLVLYKTNGSTSKAVWGTGTNGKNAASVCLQTDGNVVVYASGGSALWGSGTQGSGATQLKLQTDCNLVLYTSSGAAKWGSGTNPC